jgi:hypothetical protein
VLIRVSALAELAEQLLKTDLPLIEKWEEADQLFRSWVARPDLRITLRDYLRDLPPAEMAAVRDKSRETTTHFAWCLRDQPSEPFTFWLHEYKPQRDWRAGYADSVHNHRYHFCTTIVTGGYLHERYLATINSSVQLISTVQLVDSTWCGAGDTGMLLASDFHRIPRARDNTMTFLMKSRSITSFSLSYDPTTRASHQHIPVESRLDDLASRI